MAARYLLRPKFAGHSLGPLILAALTPPEVEVTLLDESVDRVPPDEQYDLVGITANTSQAVRAYQIADEYRRRGTPVVIGGIHATVLPEEAKVHADSVVVGEAELTWPALLRDLRSGQLRPFYRQAGVVDLRDSPVPRYDLLRGKPTEVVWVQTTRGCPHNCEFCAASRVYGRSYRRKDVAQILREVQSAVDSSGCRYVSFADDNMFLDRKRVVPILDALRSMNIRWFAQSDISIAEDPAFLRRLRHSGCSTLFIGLETLTPEGLSEIGSSSKLRHLGSYRDYVQRIQELGIGVMGAFVVGLDNDTPDIFDKISEFIISNDLYAAQITVATPVPGSRLRDRLLGEGRITNLTDWSRYTFSHVNIVPKNMSPEQLQSGYASIHRRIYDKGVLRKKLAFFKDVLSRGVLSQEEDSAPPT